MYMTIQKSNEGKLSLNHWALHSLNKLLRGRGWRKGYVYVCKRRLMTQTYMCTFDHWFIFDFLLCIYMAMFYYKLVHHSWCALSPYHIESVTVHSLVGFVYVRDIPFWQDRCVAFYCDYCVCPLFHCAMW